MKNTYANKPNTLQGFTSLYPYTKPSIKYSSKQQAFTIVELLIVIVVIAILAAISIAAYTNIQQRAKNTAIINAASQSLKMIQAYIAQEGRYPKEAVGNDCITVTSGCAVNAGSNISQSEAFKVAMSRVGVAPLSVPNIGDSYNGILYQYSGYRFVDGVSQPVKIIYWLQGTSQNCGMSGVLSTTSDIASISTTGYTIAHQDGNTGKTRCDVVVPGPSA